MNMKIFFVAAAMSWGVGPAHADVYRCTGADGKKVFQEIPCATGTQKTVDDSTTREKQKIEAQKREEVGDLKLDAAKVQGCLTLKFCESGTYVGLLRGKSRSFVTDTLGEPASVQNIGGRVTHYYVVPTSDGRKRTRLQIIYSILGVDTVNVYQ